MTSPLFQRLQSDILILDGAMGTMIQRYKLTEEDYRGEAFLHHDKPLIGNNDLLSITRPDVIKEVHRAYLDVGTDIIETNSFSANSVSQQEYALEKEAYRIAFESAKIAREVADEYTAKNPSKPRFVAGSVGPTSRSCSMSPDINDPSLRNMTFDELATAYTEQIQGLVDGGVDFILIETAFDPINVKCAIFATETVAEKVGKSVPIMISGTVSDASGRILAGQTIEAFMIAVQHAKDLFCIGLNCALGAKEMIPHLRVLAEKAPCYVHAYPNAGLPNAFGAYDQSPEMMAELVQPFATEKLVNILGGCCGTSPDHIQAMAAMMKGHTPRTLNAPNPNCMLSGLEPLKISKETNFVNVGERTNVAGSRKFLRLIKEEKYEEALDIAREQVENGAQIIDINMDDAMLDAQTCMVKFLNLIATDPAIARVPIMVDSSRFEVIEAGLKCVQGRGIVNSISLKEGEEIFREHAKMVRRLGGAVLVMLFDEKGQADCQARRLEIVERAYKILTEEVGFQPHDIIIDPNVFAIATGIEEHNNYAKDYIDSVKAIKTLCPGVLTSGGISNVSFSFRGNELIRQAIHAVFLYYAIQNGLDMGIVNPAQIMNYDDIPAEIKAAVEDAVLNKSPEATDALLEAAEKVRDSAQTQKEDTAHEWRKLPVEERLIHALIQGITQYIEPDIEECRLSKATPVEVIDDVLMKGMKIVGERFGAGKMFLPQVVKTARVMKSAVNLLMPYILESQSDAQSKAGKVILATVKGDVHDIGKNIVSVILQCNNFDVTDLGVMVPCEDIIEAAQKEKADLVVVSGLITPSLAEMEHIAKEMVRHNLNIPLMVGGATTSSAHTAVKISPYFDLVVQTGDATEAAQAALQLVSNDRMKFLSEVQAKYHKIREAHQGKTPEKVSLEEARAKGFNLDD